METLLQICQIVSPVAAAFAAISAVIAVNEARNSIRMYTKLLEKSAFTVGEKASEEDFEELVKSYH